MLTSKEILERTGISRATLNNYIGGGLIARPDVLPPGPDQGAAPRIGHFPDDTLDRIAAIQRLKRQGWSISRIAEHLAGRAVPPAADASAASPQVVRPLPASGGPPVASAAAAGLAAAPAAGLAPGAVVRPVTRTESASIQSGPRQQSMAVLVTLLEDAPRLWVQLAAREYFELVNEVWAALDQAFRAHGGQCFRLPDEEMTGCFLARPAGAHAWNALAAARQARAAMQALSLRWRQRKTWDRDLHLNTGLDAGDDWMARLGPGELRVMGETAQRAAQLARSGRGGQILATRHLVGLLAPAELERLVFGVPRAAAADSADRLLGSFLRLADFGPDASLPPALAGLAVTEILEILNPPGEPGSPGAP